MVGECISQVGLLGFSFDRVRNKNMIWLVEGSNNRRLFTGLFQFL